MQHTCNNPLNAIPQRLGLMQRMPATEAGGGEVYTLTESPERCAVAPMRASAPLHRCVNLMAQDGKHARG